MPEVAAPAGSHWEMEEVKTDRGQKSLGEVPLLVWDDLQGAVDFFGAQSILDSLDGTSLRVSYQSIGRRMKAAGKSEEEIAGAIVAFRPGKRAGGVSTPVSRARRAAESAAEASGNGDAVAALLEKIARGEIDPAELLAAAQ